MARIDASRADAFLPWSGTTSHSSGKRPEGQRWICSTLFGDQFDLKDQRAHFQNSIYGERVRRYDVSDPQAGPGKLLS